MPQRKKTVRKVSRKEQVLDMKETIKDRFAQFNLSRSYTSLAYGVITVVVLFALVFAAVRIFSQDNTPDISDEAVETANDTSNNQYTVQEGETLWSISEKTYGSGYGWSEIAKANNISNPDAIEKGTKLTMPPKETVQTAIGGEGDTIAQATISPNATATATVAPSPTAEPTKVQNQNPNQVQQGKITGANYTIQTGDTLWDIAQRAYGDPYKWTQIAQFNGLTNPNLIFAGNTLKLQR